MPVCLLSQRTARLARLGFIGVRKFSAGFWHGSSEYGNAQQEQQQNFPQVLPNFPNWNSPKSFVLFDFLIDCSTSELRNIWNALDYLLKRLARNRKRTQDKTYCVQNNIEHILFVNLITEYRISYIYLDFVKNSIKYFSLASTFTSRKWVYVLLNASARELFNFCKHNLKAICNFSIWT